MPDYSISIYKPPYDALDVTLNVQKAAVPNDPVRMATLLIMRQLQNLTAESNALAKEIEQLSTDIAEANHLWNKFYSMLSEHVNPSDPSKTTPQALKPYQTELGDAYLEFTQFLITHFGDDVNTEKVFGSLPPGQEGQSYLLFSYISYNTLEARNATMSAFSDSIQTHLKTDQTKLQNILTKLADTQDELKSVIAHSNDISKG